MTQYAHVKAVLESATKALAIHDIGAEIWRRFRVRHADTAISARIREIRKDLERETSRKRVKKTILSWRAGKHKAHHLYCIGTA
jgi:hypothetical protein